MTTREQIKQVAQERENELCSNYQSFVLGAEYGYNLALKKVCEYIKENIYLYAYKLEKSDFPYDYPLTERIVLTDNFEEDVKQAMTL